MKDTTKIAVVGGTGKSGRYLVQELLKRKFRFKILIRNPDNFKIESPLVEAIVGDVSNLETVRSLIQGCDAAISCLGWGTPPSPNTIFGTATQNILQAMLDYSKRRYIVLSGLHVDTPYDQKSVKTGMATQWMYENYPDFTKDRQLEYETLVKSDSDWTLIRLPVIELTEERRGIITSLEDCLGDRISTTDLADFLIEQLKQSTFIQKAPFLANI
ncbi:NAD(P)-dependent oxidoreductase [Maribacter algicola]|uniref:NAD(P)-dependent oxidoreductase n=1 Tax=Meishania litoralis TaxID=3434685 RepID=A0ACC7LK88_9FLAO